MSRKCLANSLHSAFSALEVRVEFAHKHLGHTCIAFVLELAQIVLLAEAARPVLADHLTIVLVVTIRKDGDLDE